MKHPWCEAWQYLQNRVPPVNKKDAKPASEPGVCPGLVYYHTPSLARDLGKGIIEIPNFAPATKCSAGRR